MSREKRTSTSLSVVQIIPSCSLRTRPWLRPACDKGTLEQNLDPMALVKRMDATHTIRSPFPQGAEVHHTEGGLPFEGDTSGRGHIEEGEEEPRSNTNAPREHD